MVRIGTSGWSYPSGQGTWNGVFYPRRRGRGFDELAYYAEHFDVVEVNSTFYRMPEAPMTRRWAERTPAGFLFAVKLFQKFTHPDMYLARVPGEAWHPSLADLDLFRAGVGPLADAGKLGPVLVQFPTSFHAGPEAAEYITWLVEALRDYDVAVEVRYRGWFEGEAGDDLVARLAAAGAALAATDSPETAPEKDVGWLFQNQNLENPNKSGHLGSELPRKSHPTSFSYVRMHGRNAAAWWHHAAAEDRYNYLYSPAELRPVGEALQRASAAGRRAFAFMNNHYSAKAVANAAILKGQLGQEVAGDYEPEMLDRYPDLQGIVRTNRLL